MLLAQARTAAMPPCRPLDAAPLWETPLAEPPRIAWIGVGRHGRWAREDYRLTGLWCVHLYRWSGALRILRAGQEIVLPVRPGYASLVPPDTELSHYFPVGGPPSLHLSSGFALSAGSETESAGAPLLAPMMQDLGDDFGRISRLFEEAIGRYAAQPRRAEARLWDLLWQLAERGSNGSDIPPATGEHPAVARTREIIELRLGEPDLRVADLASAVELSHNHLTRLFHAATGQTVVGYLRERRIARARRLLLHTTLPIKNVAAQVGLPDLHQFNKTIRAATGYSPRALRKRSGDAGA